MTDDVARWEALAHAITRGTSSGGDDANVERNAARYLAFLTTAAFPAEEVAVEPPPPPEAAPVAPDPLPVPAAPESEPAPPTPEPAPLAA